MRKQPIPAPEPKFPSLTKRCKYCHVTFKTPATYNGQQQDFCIPAHRKAFHKEGRKPILAILKRQEKHMRQIAREIAREEIEQAFKRADLPGLAAVLHELNHARQARDSFAPSIVGVPPGPLHDAILGQYAPWNGERNKK